MNTKILKVLSQTQPVYVPSRNPEKGSVAKAYIRLRELGSQFEDEFQCTLFGSLATTTFTPGSIVAAALRFTTHENNGAFFQDITAKEITPLN